MHFYLFPILLLHHFPPFSKYGGRGVSRLVSVTAITNERVGDIKRLKRLHRLAKRTVTGLKGLTNKQRLQRLHTPDESSPTALTAFKVSTGKLDLPSDLKI